MVLFLQDLTPIGNNLTVDQLSRELGVYSTLSPSELRGENKSEKLSPLRDAVLVFIWEAWAAGARSQIGV